MAFAVTAEPLLFAEAVEYFARKFPMTEELAEQFAEYAGSRAWTIAGVTQLDIVLSVHESLTEAIAKGIPFAEWQKSVAPMLTKAWGKRDAPRMQTVFRNAVQSALNAGRWQQMTEPAVKALRPFVMFDGIADARQSPICKEWDGTILSIDDPSMPVPPLHHRCRSSLRNLTEKQARERGITSQPPKISPQPGFGEPPDLSEWAPNPGDYPRALFEEYERKREQIARTAKRRKPKPKKKAA